MGSFNFGDTMKDAFSSAGSFFTFGLTGAIEQKMEGEDMSEKALEDIENFERQELSNAFKNLEVSTMGADLRREESARATAAGIKALQGAGARGVASGVTGLATQASREAASIAAILDEKQEKLNFYTASDEVRKQRMQEQRDADELAGLGKMWEIGMSMEESGTQQIGQVASSIASMGMSAGQGGLPMGGGATGVNASAIPNSAVGKENYYDYQNPMTESLYNTSTNVG